MSFISKIIHADESKMRNMKVNDKLKVTFMNFAKLCALVVLFLGLTIAMAMGSFYTMYKKYYEQDHQQGEMRINVQAYAKAAFWMLSTKEEDVFKEQWANVDDKIVEFYQNLEDLRAVYNNEENLATVEADLKTLESLTKELDELCEANEIIDGEMTNGFAIYDLLNGDITTTIKALAADLKVISTDSYALAQASFNKVLITSVIMVCLSILVIAIGVIFIKDSRNKLTKSILDPVNEMSKVASDMSNGILDVDISYESNDELGHMARDMRKATDNLKKIVTDIDETLNRVSEGDFTHGTDNPELYQEDYGSIRHSLDNITDKLSDTIGKVRESSSQVSQGAANMSQGASDLADGATNQASAVDELTASVAVVTDQTKNMAASAEQGISMANKAQESVEISARKMKLVTDAMGRITDASNEIEQVTNEIEAIAKQTQLLALNASIEAARAGDAGKGFAVVAEEITALANQSSEAAKNTHQLINDTMEEVRNGNTVVEETKEALQVVQDTVNEVTGMMKESGEMARQQADAMAEINDGIEQISNVVQNNSATAEESSAVSQELSEQSENLNDLISQFNVK
ncbi:MAG: HAMP domain-containing methyl-accepting chemotaxis protein [Butyrivibrio sp.]|nr:HAMP domain-containing methyl-accepting chemotaxis protein [Butyrivibrio sp.]